MKIFNCINCGTEKLFSHSKVNKYCGINCQLDFQYKKYIIEWKQGLQNGMRGKLQTSDYIRKYLMDKQENKCAICGIIEHNGFPITLELDHVNGDSTDNTENNLRCLCPNCHSQTPTYRAKNKGNGRKLRQ